MVTSDQDRVVAELLERYGHPARLAAALVRMSLSHQAARDIVAKVPG